MLLLGNMFHHTTILLLIKSRKAIYQSLLAHSIQHTKAVSNLKYKNHQNNNLSPTLSSSSNKTQMNSPKKSNKWSNNSIKAFYITVKTTYLNSCRLLNHLASSLMLLAAMSIYLLLLQVSWYNSIWS